MLPQYAGLTSCIYFAQIRLCDPIRMKIHFTHASVLRATSFNFHICRLNFKSWNVYPTKTFPSVNEYDSYTSSIVLWTSDYAPFYLPIFMLTIRLTTTFYVTKNIGIFIPYSFSWTWLNLRANFLLVPSYSGKPSLPFEINDWYLKKRKLNI